MITWYQNGVAIGSAFIFFTNIPLFLSVKLGIGIPLYWMLGLYVLAFPILIHQITKSDLLVSPVVLWGLGYLWISIVWFIPFSQSESEWQQLRWRMLAMLNLLVFLAVVGTPERNKLGRYAIVTGVLFAVVLCIYELFFPDTFSVAVGRSAALYLDPNLAGEALVLGMIIGVTVLPHWTRGAFILVTGVGLFVTFSRGGMLAWSLAVVGLSYVGTVRVRDLMRSVGIALVVAILVLVPRWDDLLTTLERSGTLNKNVEQRLAWLTNPSSSADDAGSDDSSWGRRYLLRQAWGKFSEHPWTGSGTGSSHGIGGDPPHNLSVALMVDHGVIGALVLPLLVLALLWRQRGEYRGVMIVFGCTLVLFSLFSHNIISFPQHLVMFAIVSSMSASKELVEERWPIRFAEARREEGLKKIARA